MLHYLKYIIQLILSPKNGWEDLAVQQPPAKTMLSRGFYPLLAVSVLTELLGLVYHQDSLLRVVVSAFGDFGAYFLAVYLTRLVLSVWLPKLSKGEVDEGRIEMFSIMAVGLMVFFRIIDNVLPWSLMLLKFLPLYVVLVLSKSFAYLGVRRDCEMHFLLIASLVVVAAPLGFYYLVYMLIQ